MNAKLKQYIFNKLYKRLSNAEIIPYNNSIWFIDREERYWYFELENNGTLYWRYGFFPNFFMIFSMERDQFEPIISEWVEEVLNHKVSTTYKKSEAIFYRVEEVLNHKVSTTQNDCISLFLRVEEVLNHKVSTTSDCNFFQHPKVEEVLNHKVSTTCDVEVRVPWKVEEVLNHKSFTKIDGVWRGDDLVEEILNENPTE